MASLKRRVFQSALGVHTTLKSVPYYTRAYDFAKAAVLQQSNSDLRQGAYFATDYETESLQPKTILYESFHGGSMACGPAAIFEAALRDDRFAGFTHVWVLDDPNTVPARLKTLNRVKIITRDSRDYPRYLATAGYLVNNSTFPFWYLRRDGQVYVNTWHGTPLKTMFRDEKGPPARFANSQRNFLQASHIIMSSDFATDHLLGSADVLALCRTKTWQIGTPRLDRTLAGRAAFQADPAMRHYLFAPTWRGLVGHAVSQTHEIEALIKALDVGEGPAVTLHVKAHNFNTDDLSHLAGLSTGRLTIKAVGATDDINDVMARMDAVITDYSSLMIDALAADIPVVLFVPDLDVYSAARGLYVDLASLPVALAHDKATLTAALADLKAPGDQDGADAARAAYYPDEDGAAATRALDIMLAADTAPAPIARDAKPVIGIMAGGWKRNGITASAANLLANIDLATYDVVVFTAGQKLDEDAWPQIAAVRDGIMFVHRVGQECFTQPETGVKSAFYETNSLGDAKASGIMQQAMRREARRIAGDIHFAAAIDFSGYQRLWAWIIAMMSADQTIIYQHNDLKSERDKRFAILEGVFATYRFYDRIVSVSEETRALNAANLADYYAKDASIAIRNALNVPAIQTAAKDGPGSIVIDGAAYTPLSTERSDGSDTVALKAMPVIDQTRTNFITMGRCSGEKNHRMLLRAFKRLQDTQPNTHLYILGEGPLLDDTRAYRDALGLQDSVTMPGYASNALRVLDECDCFVLPSFYEGQPMVILEALALDKPVIVTDIAGSRSALAGGHGFIVEGAISDKSFAAAMEAFCKGKLSFKPFDATGYTSTVMADFHAMIAKGAKP